MKRKYFFRSRLQKALTILTGVGGIILGPTILIILLEIPELIKLRVEAIGAVTVPVLMLIALTVFTATTPVFSHICPGCGKDVREIFKETGEPWWTPEGAPYSICDDCFQMGQR